VAWLTAQVALAFLLLIGAGLLLGSFPRRAVRGSGFQEEGLWSGSWRPGMRYRTTGKGPVRG
jgi:hypothetical protein